MFLTQTRLGDDSPDWTETVIAEYSEGDDSALHKNLQCKLNMTMHDNASLYLCNTQETVSRELTTI